MITLTPTDRQMPHSIFRAVSVGRAFELLRAEHVRQFARLQKEIGFDYVRFHGLFADDMAVAVRGADGRIRYQWHNIDRVFDFLRELRIRPLVQLGAMPAALAEGPETIFWWKMHVSRPKDYGEWYDLVRAFISHMVDRYGLDEVRQWYFEVWNEPNLKGFWPHGMEEYYRLYTYAARAVKSVDSALRVGGPATAGGAYVRETIDYCVKNRVPLDFITTHAYPIGEYCEYPERENSPYELGRYFAGRFREVYDAVKSSPLPNLEIHWTEWNTQSANSSKNITWIHNPTVDLLYGAGCVAKEMLSVMDLCDSVAYWVVSDLFEESGPKHSPFSCTYGLMNINGIPKATYNAYKLLRKLRGYRMAATFSDAVPPFCDLCATTENGVMRAVLYNHQALEYEHQDDFCETLHVPVPEDGRYIATFATIRARQGSPYETWLAMGMPQDLSPVQEEMLEAHSTPDYDFVLLDSREGFVDIPFVLRPNEVMYCELQRQGAAADLGAAGDAAAGHLNELLMLEKK